MSELSGANPRKLLLLEVAGLFLIILLAAVLRYPNLATNPGWYSDEGTLIDIADHLADGQVQSMAIKGPLLIVGRQPLFVGLLSLIFRVAGAGILQLRALSATLGILSIALLYLLVRVNLGREGIPLAALSALLMAISPEGILYSRVAFSYSLMTPLLLLCMLGSWMYGHSGRRSWLVLAALMVGIGTLSDLIMITVILPLLIVVLVRRWQDIFLAILLSLLPMIIYLAILLIGQPRETLFDLHTLLIRTNGLPLIALIPAWIINFGLLLSQEPWFLPAIIGLFMIKPLRFGQFLILFWALPILIMARSIIVARYAYYYVSPFLPLISLGVAAVIYFGAPRIQASINDAWQFILQRWNTNQVAVHLKRLRIGTKILSGLAITGIVIFPLLYYFINAAVQVRTHIDSSMDWILVDPVAGEKAISFVNERVSADDLVIASPALAWGLHCRRADFQMAVIIDGVTTLHFPAGVDPSRFAYDTHLSKARYVILDRVWDQFGVKLIPQVADLAETIQDQWPLVFQAGDVRVYQNPVMNP